MSLSQELECDRQAAVRAANEKFNEFPVIDCNLSNFARVRVILSKKLDYDFNVCYEACTCEVSCSELPE